MEGGEGGISHQSNCMRKTFMALKGTHIAVGSFVCLNRANIHMLWQCQPGMATALFVLVHKHSHNPIMVKLYVWGTTW